MSKPETHLALTQRLQSFLTLQVSPHALQQGIVLLVATLLGNLIQYLFHFFAGRALGPTEYGVFASLLALSVILTVPTGIAQTVITQYVAGFFAREEMGKIWTFVRQSAWTLSVVSLLILGAIISLSPAIAAFLNISSIWPVIAMGTFFLFSGPMTTLTGALQGVQRFQLVAAQFVLGPAFRLFAALFLVGVGFGASGALGATAVSNLLVLILTAPFIRDLMCRAENHGLSISQISRYSGIVLGGTLAFAVVTNVDLVIVKHFFTPLETGYYSAASVLGKTILALPGAVAMLMFPKTASRHALGQDASELARKSTFVSFGLCGVASAFLYLFQDPAVRIMFGADYESGARLVGMYGATMGLYALVQVLLTFYISQQDARFVWLLSAVTCILAVFLSVVRLPLEQIILSLALGAIVILVVAELWLGGLGLVKLIRKSV